MHVVFLRHRSETHLYEGVRSRPHDTNALRRPAGTPTFACKWSPHAAAGKKCPACTKYCTVSRAKSGSINAASPSVRRPARKPTSNNARDSLCPRGIRNVCQRTRLCESDWKRGGQEKTNVMVCFVVSVAAAARTSLSTTPFRYRRRSAVSVARIELDHRGSKHTDMVISATKNCS